MLQEMITQKELITMDKGYTPLSLVARIFLLYNQSEGRASRTQGRYRLCMDRLILDFGPNTTVSGITEDALRVHIVAYQEKAHPSTGKPLMESTMVSLRPKMELPLTFGHRIRSSRGDGRFRLIQARGLEF